MLWEVRDHQSLVESPAPPPICITDPKVKLEDPLQTYGDIAMSAAQTLASVEGAVQLQTKKETDAKVR